jgi:hypothetical protein
MPGNARGCWFFIFFVLESDALKIVLKVNARLAQQAKK